MANIAIDKNAISNADIVRSHMAKHGAISTKDAAHYYGMTGGTVTKVISELRKYSNIAIAKSWVRDSVTGRRFASYRLAYGDIIPAFAIAYITR